MRPVDPRLLREASAARRFLGVATLLGVLVAVAIVAQAVVPVLDGDDEAALAARVLRLEHRMYPSAVRWFVEGLLAVEGARVRHAGGEPQMFS